MSLSIVAKYFRFFSNKNKALFNGGSRNKGIEDM